MNDAERTTTENSLKASIRRAFVANLMDGQDSGRITIAMDAHDMANTLTDIAMYGIEDHDEDASRE